jgi:sugar lactone lactonase YvrE
MGLRFVTQFNAAMGQLPEGLAFREGMVYVGFAPTGQILRVDPATGMTTMFGQVPIPPSMNPAMPNGYALGLAFDTMGNLYVAAPSFGTAFQAGVYRIAPAGGTATRFATDAMMRFPNAIEFDAMGNLYVSDSGTGTIFRISSDGMTVRPWLTHMLFMGGSTQCGPGAGFPIGINGIVYDRAGMNVYAVNTDNATVLRVPVMADGSAGTPVVLVAQDCARLGGADGLTRGPDGALYVAANAANSITRVPTDGMNVTAIESRGVLDSPASLVFGMVGGRSTLFITNAAFTSAQMMGGMPRPGLLARPTP